jgi:DNA-binding IclR family transcriptional regulator
MNSHEGSLRKKDAEGSADRPGALLKALDLLELAVAQEEPATAAQLAIQSGIASPTVHRLVAILRDHGFLGRELGSSRLIEGDRLVNLAIDVLASFSQRGPRHEILASLAAETGETANVGVMRAGQVVYVDRVESKWPLALRFEAGSEVPAHCTAIGKLFLAFMTPSKRDKYLSTLPLTPYTEHTHTSRDSLEADLDAIRTENLSIDNCEFMSGVVCLAVPVRRPDGRVVAGVAISAPEARFNRSGILTHAASVRDAAARLGRTLERDAE